MKFILASAVTLASLAAATPATKPACGQPEGSQVLRYPGFETGNGFSAQSVGSGTFYSRIVEPGRHSAHALANTLNAGSQDGEAVGILTQGLNTCDGDSYTYSIDYKYRQYGSGDTGVNVYIQYGPQGEGPPTYVLPSSTNGGAKGTGGNGVWATQSYTFTAQNHLGAGSLMIQIASSAQQNETVVLDNVSITKN